MATNSFEGTLKVSGDLQLGGRLKPPLTRDQLDQDDAVPYPQRLTDLVVWDSGQPLPAAAASDDLGLAAGTWGTDNLYVSAGDLKAAGATTRRTRILATLPAEYVDGQTVQVRLAAGMKTTVADTACTVDVEIFKVGRDMHISGSDLVTTAAQSINSLTFADKTFNVDPATLSAGDQLDVRISITCTDAATVTAVIPALAALDLLLDIQG